MNRFSASIRSGASSGGRVPPCEYRSGTNARYPADAIRPATSRMCASGPQASWITMTAGSAPRAAAGRTITAGTAPPLPLRV